MRPLIQFFFLLFSFEASALYQSAGLSYGLGQNVSYYRDTEISVADTSTTTLDYGLFELGDYHNFTMSFDQVHVPYESLIVKRQNTSGDVELISLDRLYENKPEHWISLGYEFLMGPVALTLSGRDALDDVPFDNKSYSLSASYDVGERTKIKTGFNYQKNTRPLSFITDSQQNTVQLPTKSYLRRLSLGVEQILHKQLKGLLSIETAKRSGERPRHLGYQGVLAYAITDSVFAKAGHQRRNEINSRIVQTVGGHLDYRSSYLELSWEPTFDLLLSASYQLVTEDQLESLTERETRVAFDEYGLAAAYEFTSELQLNIGASLVDSNIFKEQINLELGASWTF